MNNDLVGTVNIIRDKKFMGSFINFELYIDNQPAGIIKNGTNLSIPVYFGNHIVTLKTIDKTVDKEIVLSSTQRNAYILCDCSMGLLVGRPHIKNFYYN